MYHVEKPLVLLLRISGRISGKKNWSNRNRWVQIKSEIEKKIKIFLIEQIIVFIIDDLLNAKKILKKISFQIDEKKIYFLNVFFEYLKAPNHFYLKTKIFLLN